LRRRPGPAGPRALSALDHCGYANDAARLSAARASRKARPQPRTGPVQLLGLGATVETSIVIITVIPRSRTSSRAFRVAGTTAFAEAGITRNDVDHLMIYDAFFRLSIYSFEDLGFIPRGEAGAFIAERNTVPASPGRPAGPAARGSRSTPMAAAFPILIPACTAYTRCRKSVRQMRGVAAAQIPGLDLGLPRCRRHVRRLRHDHHVERAAVGRGV
jgi:hypothetical protein